MKSELHYCNNCVQFFRITPYVDVPVDLVGTRLPCARRRVLLENVLHEKCMERARLPCRGWSAFSTRATRAFLSSREYTGFLPPGGYPIAERGYKNRINRVYAIRGEGNAAKANISR